MKPEMPLTAYKVTATRNAYGDFTASGETAIACWFRYIENVQLTGNNEQSQADAMIWTEPDSGLLKNSIVKFEGEHFIVERVIKGREVENGQVNFLKCELLHYGVIS